MFLNKIIPNAALAQSTASVWTNLWEMRIFKDVFFNVCLFFFLLIAVCRSPLASDWCYDILCTTQTSRTILPFLGAHIHSTFCKWSIIEDIVVHVSVVSESQKGIPTQKCWFNWSRQKCRFSDWQFCRCIGNNCYSWRCIETVILYTIIFELVMHYTHLNMFCYYTDQTCHVIAYRGILYIRHINIFTLLLLGFVPWNIKIQNMPLLQLLRCFRLQPVYANMVNGF